MVFCKITLYWSFVEPFHYHLSITNQILICRWSNNGILGLPQPDNRELRVDGLDGNESCLAVMETDNGSGPEWHDRACYHQSAFVCEDSPKLLRYALRLAARSRKMGHDVPRILDYYSEKDIKAKRVKKT